VIDARQANARMPKSRHLIAATRPELSADFAHNVARPGHYVSNPAAFFALYTDQIAHLAVGLASTTNAGTIRPPVEKHGK